MVILQWDWLWINEMPTRALQLPFAVREPSWSIHRGNTFKLPPPIQIAKPNFLSLVCMHARWLQSCSTLCDPMYYSPPGSSVHEIVQARIVEWIAVPPPGDLPDTGIEATSLMSPTLAGGFFTTSATWEALPYNLPYRDFAPEPLREQHLKSHEDNITCFPLSLKV